MTLQGAAISSYAAQQAIDLKDDFREAWSNKGVTLEKLGRTEEAIDAYRCTVDLQSDYGDALSNDASKTKTK